MSNMQGVSAGRINASGDGWFGLRADWTESKSKSGPQITQISQIIFGWGKFVVGLQKS
jgi:hypothetical protein